MTDTLNPGQTLRVGQSITSANGNFTVKYRADGNLELTNNGRSLWDSGARGGLGITCPHHFEIELQK
jgi:hypothetical protein